VACPDSSCTSSLLLCPTCLGCPAESHGQIRCLYTKPARIIMSCLPVLMTLSNRCTLTSTGAMHQQTTESDVDISFDPQSPKAELQQHQQKDCRSSTTRVHATCWLCAQDHSRSVSCSLERSLVADASVTTGASVPCRYLQEQNWVQKRMPL